VLGHRDGSHLRQRQNPVKVNLSGQYSRCANKERRSLPLVHRREARKRCCICSSGCPRIARASSLCSTCPKDLPRHLRGGLTAVALSKFGKQPMETQSSPDAPISLRAIGTHTSAVWARHIFWKCVAEPWSPVTGPASTCCSVPWPRLQEAMLWGVFGMPREAILLDATEEILPLYRIPQVLLQHVNLRKS
jgi:hypothetical protein